MSDVTLGEITRKGGESTKKRYGRDHYSKISKKGKEAIEKKYGKEYFTKFLPAKAKEARDRKKAEASKPGLLESIAKIISSN